MGKLSVVLLLWIVPLHSLAAPATPAPADSRADEEYGSIFHLQQLTDDLRIRMEIVERVVVTATRW
jgi:hypothetical protein